MKSNSAYNQMSLFDEPQVKQTTNQLKIVGNKHNPLSKNQEQFNKLTKRIELLEQNIESETQKCENLLQLYAKKIQPDEIKLAEARMELAMIIGASTQKYKFSKKSQEKIIEVILDLCDKAFQYIEPSPEQETFYNKWSEKTYKEELDNQENDVKNNIFDIMEDMFGYDVNREEFAHGMDDLGSIFEKIASDFEEKQTHTNKKKTKKQAEREQHAKAEEAIKAKTIRGIYISLAKILHPDTETNLELKLEKEDLMKKVTVAFEQKDLPTLLKLELEWVHKENMHLEKLTEEKLKIYISSLKQQVADLEQKKFSIRFNPRYQGISGIILMNEKQANFELNKISKELKKMLHSVNTFSTDFKMPEQKKPISFFVDEYYDLISNNDLFYNFELPY